MNGTSVKCLHYDAYTVGWICALPVEMAAAKAVLDERHQCLPQPLRDINTYVLGEIFGHNIVIGCLPSGEYGTNSAATISTQMLLTFPNIQFTVLVGIGGGAPGIIDVRLGDVVVSNPTGIHGGVVQYDLGKTVGDGYSVHTGMLNRPPQRLLTAVANLISDCMLGVSRIPEFLLEIRTKYPKTHGFQYPESAVDNLFQPNYDHPDNKRPCDKCCDMEKVVSREPRMSKDPRIHYGLIASGNQVIKHAASRDRIAQEHGVICFEMEAAGLMNHSPCLVIRGICDYADSHKNKQWQGYAAATAAAYTKELLAMIKHSETLGEIVPFGHTPDDGHADEESMFLALAWRPERQITRHVENVLFNIYDRLSNYDPRRICRDHQRRRCPATTTWILSNATFKSWLDRRCFPCLWLTGKIGCGKTLVTSTVVQFLEERPPHLFTPVAYFFYSHSDRGHLKARDMFESFTKQILDYMGRTSRPCPSQIIQNLKRLYKPGSYPSSTREMIEDVFIPVMQLEPDAIYVVDGLDECDRPEVLEIFEIFREMIAKTQCRILATGRDGIDLKQAIPQAMTVGIANQGNDNDIRKFIDWKIDVKSRDRPLTENAGLIQAIKTELLNRADRMFLWVSLQLDLLWEECYTDAEIREAIDDLPKDLSETYNRCLSRIDRKHNRLAHKVLYWVCAAIKPFEACQIQEALAMDPESGLIDPQKMRPIREIIKLCSHLVIHDTNGTIRLTHATVNQFLRERSAQTDEDSGKQALNNAKAELGGLCITYLLSLTYMRQYETYHGRLDVSPVLQTIKKHVPHVDRLGLGNPRSAQVPWPPERSPHGGANNVSALFHFAKYHWARLTDSIDASSPYWQHFRKIALEQHLSLQVHPWESIGQSAESHFIAMLGWAIDNRNKPLFSLASDSSAMGLNSDMFSIPLYHYNNIPLLHLAARKDFPQAIEYLIPRSKHPLLDLKGRSALHHAAEAGSIDAMMLLLDSLRTSINDRDVNGHTPLHLAAMNKESEMITLLMMKGAASSTMDKKKRTPMFYALCNFECSTLQALISGGADVNSRDAARRSPLFVAAGRLNNRAISMLLQNGADVKMRTMFGKTALDYAVIGFRRHCNADIESVIEACHQAVQLGLISVVDCFLQLSVGLDWSVDQKSSLLKLAVRLGHFAIADLIVERPSPTCGIGISKSEPFLCRDRPIIRCLELAKEVNYPGLLEDARTGHIIRFKTLVDDLIGRSCHSLSVLPMLACIFGHVEVLKSFINQGFVFDAVAILYYLPLRCDKYIPPLFRVNLRRILRRTSKGDPTDIQNSLQALQAIARAFDHADIETTILDIFYKWQSVGLYTGPPYLGE